MDRYPIRITLLANAGVLIRYRDTALLLDGLFGRKDNPFSLLPPGCREAMLRAEPPFERLDYLLFTHYHPDHFDPEMAAIQIEPGISVQAFMVPHLGEEYRAVPHVCYLLTFDGRRVLFTADSDYLHEDFSRLADTPLYAVFLNPLFYQAYYNTRLFHGHFDTDTLCVYHVPFPEDDGMHMQDMARRMPRGAADSGLRVLPLTEPMQQIEL